MAPISTVSQTPSALTLPRLLAINKDFTGLDEQIDQATHIIGLPENWATIQKEEARSQVIQKLVRARAEWVVKWILEKLKDNGDSGLQARANSRAWNLLDWMVQVLPTSRSATQLRDADFLAILERTLRENFDKDAATTEDARMKDASESSETVQEDSKPSRKRKRPSPSTSTPSKKVSLRPDSLEPLFGGIVNVVRSITNRASSHKSSEETVHTEHMKMALRTESAQAARILKGWFAAVNRLLVATPTPVTLPDACLDLSLVLKIWELRRMDADDPSGSSADQFSAECLIPLLILYGQLQDDANRRDLGHSTIAILRGAAQSLERLLARNLFAPSRAAFFSDAATQTDVKLLKAEQLASNLEPLRAKILQAAQIQDTSEPIPSFFMPLFSAIPQLLAMAIRMSPSRTPRNRIAERPWIQAVFIALCECAGCPLEAPTYLAPQASIEALEKSLNVLNLHDVKIDSGILADLFWFHSGVKFPLGQKRDVHWSLIAALIRLDPDTFVSGSTSSSDSSEGRPGDLTKFLFDQISSTTVARSNSLDSDAMDIDSKDGSSNGGTETLLTNATAQKETILRTVVIPVLAAFARNRDLPGFINRWYAQLCENAPVERGNLTELKPSVWEDRTLDLALADLLEQSLTQTQIKTLFELYASRVKPPKAVSETESMKQAFGSAVIVRSLLWSISSHELIEALEPILRPLLKEYTDLVEDDWYRKHTDLASSWITLCRLLVLLWPIHIHSSVETQKGLLLHVIEQASQDVSTTSSSKTKAAALLFLLTSSDHLRTVPGWDHVLRESVRKILKALSPSRLEPTELSQMVEIFCSEFIPLLDYIEEDTRKEALLRLLTRVADLDQSITHDVADGLSLAIFSSASYPVREAYSEALLEAVDQTDDDGSLQATAEIASVQIQPSALSRERREAVLDKMAGMLASKPRDVELLLSVMVSLQQVPNATAKISSDGDTFFDIAETLHSNGCETQTTLQLFYDLVRLTLDHMLPNKDQAQNKQYLENFQSRLTAVLRKPQQCSPARLSILRAVFIVQKGNELIPSEQYLGFLNFGLHGSSISVEYLAAYNELPVESEDMFKLTQATLRLWVDTNVDLQSLELASDGDVFPPSVPKECWAQFHSLIAKFKLYPDIKWLIGLSTKLLRQIKELSGQHEHHDATILRAVGGALSTLPVAERLDLIPLLTQNDGEASFRLLHALVTTLDDKGDEDAEGRKQKYAILPTICSLLADASTTSSFSALMDTVDTIIRDKPSLTSQHSIECVMTVLTKLASRNSPKLPSSSAPAIYTRLCETSRYILLLHRGRLGGRFHLLLPVLQNLLLCLFIPHAGRHNMLPAWLQSPSPSTHIALTPTNASQYTRILSTLCSPTQSSVSKSNQHHRSSSNNAKSNLNDPVKAAREYASHYMYPLLASFCRFQLSGRLDGSVREKLLPGVWEAVGTAGLDRDSLEAMFAGLDKSSREIWRGVWEEWKKLSGREKTVVAA